MITFKIHEYMEENIYDYAPQPEEKQMTLSREDKAYLVSGAAWARFLAVMMFIGLGLGLLFTLMGVIAVGAAGMSMADIYDGMYGSNPVLAIMYGKIFWPMMIFVIIIMLVYFFPAFYLYMFGSKTRKAIEADDEAVMSEAFRNMRSYFRFVGWMVISLLALYLLLIIYMVIVGISMAAMM